MSSASKLSNIAVTELPYVSVKEKRLRNIKLSNKLTDELMRSDIQIKDIMRWELKLIYIIHTEFRYGKGCLGNVNLSRVTIDENKELYFNPSDKEFVSKDYNHPLRLMKTILLTHDEIYEKLAEVKHSRDTSTKIQILKTVSDYFYSFATSTTINLGLDSFMIRCNHLAEMIDAGMIDVLSVIMKS